MKEGDPHGELEEWVRRLRTSPWSWLVPALAAAGAALVAATWLLAQQGFLARQRSLEAEVRFLRVTHDVDVPRLLADLQRLAGPAADRLELQELKQRHSSLQRAHRSTLEELQALRRRRRLEERFPLRPGATRQLLEGKVPLALEGVEAGGATVALAGAPAALWRPGDYRDLNFGGGRYRLTLEAIQAAGGEASFRLDALQETPGVGSAENGKP